tara:strand:+ start:23 stop:733 length:711 start_codon:yes stop_codon:yes gene_type:complete
MFFKDFKIKFMSPLKGHINEPKPSLLHIPKAYKDLAAQIKTIRTVKRCIPFLDALSSGYIIPFPVDILYHYDEEKKACNFLIHENISTEFHSLIGVNAHDSSQTTANMRSNKRTIDDVFKFINPWIIKTPPGYSCLFLSPLNHNLPFELISGVVDTDLYETQVNLPFYWTAPYLEEKLLKCGTPMVMVIPFKRESWKMKLEVSNMNDLEMNKEALSYFKERFDNYKKKTWQKKSYK